MIKGRIGIYGMVPVDLLQEAGLTLTDLKVYTAIASFQGNSDKAWPSREQIAERAGVFPGKVSYATSNLEKMGWLKKRRRSATNKTNEYWILFPVEENTDVPDSDTSIETDVPDSGTSDVPDSGTSSIEKNNRKEQSAVFFKMTDEFFELWKFYPRKLERNRALKAYIARRRSGQKHEDLLSATLAYAEACKGKDPKYIKYAATFFGPDEPYLDYTSKTLSPGGNTLSFTPEQMAGMYQESQERNRKFIESGGRQ